MPLLIDGNNLLYAARELEDPQLAPGRALLCARLSEWASRRGQRIHVVFDGPTPARGFAEQIQADMLVVEYSGASSADTVLIERLEENSAPRRLLVVSTDGVVQKAARRRQATAVRADEFWRQLRKDLARRPQPPSPEPLEKRHGLSHSQTEEWLREFGMSGHGREKPDEPSAP